MLIPPIIMALAASSTAAFPRGFTAQCADGKEAYVWLGAGDISRPAIHLRSGHPSSTASSAPVAIPGYVPPNGGTVTLSYRNSRFSIETRGADFDVVQINGRESRFRVIKATPGDLALSVQTSTWGASLTVYHLRYKGNVGALSITRTSYDDHGDDRTSLTVMTCKIGTQFLQ